MINKTTLNGKWKLTYRDLKNPKNVWGRWIDCCVPCDVQMALMQENLITEPLVSDNNHKNAWIEDKQWIFKKRVFFDKNTIKKKCRNNI